MTDKARELLERALEALEWEYGGEPLGSLTHQSIQEIRTYLSEKQDQPKPKLDPEPVKEILHTLLGAER